MKPAIPLHDKRFKYVASGQTDLKATFRRIKKELREAEDRKAAEFRNIFSIKRV